MRRFGFCLVVFGLSATGAGADYMRWSAERVDDPFADQNRMIMSFVDGSESGLFLICDEASDYLTIRLALPLSSLDYNLPTYSLSEHLQVDDFESHIELGNAITLANGNLGVDAGMEGESARRFLDDLVEARSALYLKISEVIETTQFPVNGSTAAARAMISFCLTEESIPEPLPELTAEDRKPKTIDWEAYKRELDANLEAAGTLLSPPTDRRTAIEHIANARAIAHICQSEELDLQTLSSLAARWQIDMNIGTPDFSDLLTATENQIAYHKSNREEATCHSGDYLYGPDGRAITALIKPLD
ncbi:hypothetical protein [Martelella soudanensis]|uniref:hypothetical protein n=1 Tax=unclassified Martelella TaxID=2629616 RepID=UPI0015DF0219|nr:MULTISPECIES: hypothetical protein [unclassified Martelella]